MNTLFIVAWTMTQLVKVPCTPAEIQKNCETWTLVPYTRTFHDRAQAQIFLNKKSKEKNCSHFELIERRIP